MERYKLIKRSLRYVKIPFPPDKTKIIEPIQITEEVVGYFKSKTKIKRAIKQLKKKTENYYTWEVNNYDK